MTARQWSTLVLLSLIWGSSFLFIKVGVAEMPPVWVVWGRLFAGTLFLAGLAKWQGVGLPEQRYWLPLLPIAFFNNVLPFTLIAWGETSLESGLASVLNATTPLFSVLLMSTVGDERWSWGKGLGVLVGFVGVSILLGADLRALAVADLAGQLAIIGASFFYAVGAVLVRRYLKGGQPISLALGQLALALFLATPMALANVPVGLPSAVALSAVTALGLFGSGLAYALYYNLITTVGATRTLIVTYMVPVTALLWGWLFLDETLSWRILAGLVLIISGIALVNRRQQPKLAPQSTLSAPLAPQPSQVRG